MGPRMTGQFKRAETAGSSPPDRTMHNVTTVQCVEILFDNFGKFKKIGAKNVSRTIVGYNNECDHVL